MRVHMCMSVRGALNWDKATLKRNARGMSDPYGNPMTPDQVRNALMDELAQGHEVIPLGECDNFDFKTGCKGHEDKDSNPSHHDGAAPAPSVDGVVGSLNREET